MAFDYKEFDVRPILADGREPFQAIMAAVDSLGTGQGLILLAPFRPSPLFSVMERKGFSHQVFELEGGDFKIQFTPRATEVLASGDVRNAEEWPQPVRALDLTDLNPTKSQARVLSELVTLTPGDVLFAVFAEEPLRLFPELSDRGHQWVGNFDKNGASFRIMVKRGMRKHSGE
ncbi:hypothetical protein BLJAPNOD_04692 [Ensifer sp. M14]|uniref:DUF2249 domain-containing protein n=1 Tax=Ensifer sp. M14 TaxID=2203782 RepID=UPI000E1D0A68|nr:DUF2249 domain-containing protein [Ensifer sp. M14]RDL48417.1 hypothetical protein BLJAPNOD_04692 [Ensifer sp. M14]